MDKKTLRLAAAEMGRKGGKRGGAKGGRNRMALLTPAERSALARKAAKARWSRRRRKGEK